MLSGFVYVEREAAVVSEKDVMPLTYRLLKSYSILPHYHDNDSFQ